MQHGDLKPKQDKFYVHAVIPECYPFVKWAGGKTQLLKELERYIPQGFERYFEPFLGGGAFFFYLVSVKQLQFTAYLSDLNTELIDTYRVVKENVQELIDLLRIHEKNYYRNRHEYYYQLRSKIDPTNDVERAARFIALNKTCYNGLYRVNKSGMFNVPMGKYKNPLICDSENLRNVSIALRHSKANLIVGNYKDISEDAQRADFVYLDPPYKPTSSTAHFTAYTNNGFYDKDQLELYNLFEKLDRKGCYVMLSNSDAPFIRDLYKEYGSTTAEVKAIRAINCKGSKRTGHSELLIRNYDS
jgi:DNA adenine methylase